MNFESTLVVLNHADVKAGPGVTQGQSLKAMIGTGKYKTDRIRIAMVSYEPGTIEQLHWHPIEACYFVVSGYAIIRDINGKEYKRSIRGYFFGQSSSSSMITITRVRLGPVYCSIFTSTG